MKRHALFLLISIFIAGNTGCIKKRDRQAEIEVMIQQEVKDRLASYREARIRQCQEEILEEATRRSDSIMILEALLAKDTLSRPPRPDRPVKPEIRSLDDTTPIRPLLPPTDTIESDSVQPEKNG